MCVSMTSPSATPSFSARLDRLLDEVPRVPGSSERYSVGDVITMLATAVAGEGRRARAIAAAWLDSAREATEPPGPADRPALEALASLFRVPAEYFVDDTTTEVVLRRLELARRANDARVRVIGPCRTRHMSPAALEEVHRHLLDALDQRREQTSGE